MKGSVPLWPETEHIGGDTKETAQPGSKACACFPSTPLQFNKISEALSCLVEGTAPKASINTEQDWAETGIIRKRSP